MLPSCLCRQRNFHPKVIHIRTEPIYSKQKIHKLQYPGIPTTSSTRGFSQMQSFINCRHHPEDTVTHSTARCGIFGLNSMLPLSLGDHCGSVFLNWGLNLKIHFFTFLKRPTISPVHILDSRMTVAQSQTISGFNKCNIQNEDLIVFVA